MPPAGNSSLARFRAALAGSLQQLEERRQEINDLNVFPVADGDTGDNMVLTLQACVDELDRLASDSGGRTLDEIGRDEIVDLVARAALLGARGNSGVILSQLIRGAAEALISRPGVLVDPLLIGEAMQRASERAYTSVREPAEGTILTVMKDMAGAAAEAIPVLPPMPDTATPEEQNLRIADILEICVRAGEESVRRGPELLPVLQEAGVVDAGGYGVVVLFAGCVTALRGEKGLEIEHHSAPARASQPEHSSSTFRYCTNFAVTAQPGAELAEPSMYVGRLEEIGDSVLVVGDHVTLRVHVHTDEPDAAAAVFEGAGTVTRTDIADMHEQVAERDRRLAAPAAPEPAGEDAACGVLAVVSGDGIADLYRSLGATVLDGGETMNPSTYEILAGIHTVPAREVVVLPNSPNVRMAAQAAAEMSGREVRVVESNEPQAGLSAVLAFSQEARAAANASAMASALEAVRTGSVAPAARDDAEGRFSVGEAVGYVDGELVSWGAPRETLGEVISRLSDGSELLTVISASDAPLGEDEVEALAGGGVELEMRHGGQPSRWWLLSAE
ncbi:MAG: DAK2 domain-containing protein [Solirubrobacterales bacterium]